MNNSQKTLTQDDNKEIYVQPIYIHKIKWKPIIMILLIALFLIASISALVIVLNQVQYSVQIIHDQDNGSKTTSNYKTLDYNNRSIILIAKKNNNIFSNAEFEHYGDSENIINMSALEPGKIRVALKEGVYGSPNELNIKIIFSTKYEKIQKLDVGFYETYKPFFYNQIINWKNPFTVFGVAQKWGGTNEYSISNTFQTPFDFDLNMFNSQDDKDFFLKYYVGQVPLDKSDYSYDEGDEIVKNNSLFSRNGIPENLSSGLTLFVPKEDPNFWKFFDRIINGGTLKATEFTKLTSDLNTTNDDIRTKGKIFNFNFSYSDSVNLINSMNEFREPVVVKQNAKIRFCKINGLDLVQGLNADFDGDGQPDYGFASSLSDYYQTINGYAIKLNLDKLNPANNPAIINFPSYAFDPINSKIYCIDELVNSTNTNFFPSYQGTIFIEGGIKKIGKRAFHNSNMSKIIIDEGVEEIDDYAFSGCNNLLDIWLPSSIKKISSLAFAKEGSDSALTSAIKIHIPDITNLEKTLVKIDDSYTTFNPYKPNVIENKIFGQYINSSSITLGGFTFNNCETYDILDNTTPYF